MSEIVRARLSAPGPKRILALDGGGTRGIITIQFLKRIEALLGERFHRNGLYAQPEDFRLSHYFDLIGGTSVGALIAAQLAQGDPMSVIEARFKEWAPTVFQRKWFRYRAFFTQFRAAPLTVKLKHVFGDAELQDPRFETGLVIIVKRADTGSVWPICNNPHGRYWGDDPPAADASWIPNRKYIVREVLRASSAAPSYFRPKTITVAEPAADTQQKPQVGLFVDGAVSPHNNPALQLLMMARLSGYNMGGGPPGQEKAWPLGETNLLIVNVGTGMHATSVQRSMFLVREAVDNLTSMIGDAEQLVLTVMQGMSNPRDPWHIDGELGTLNTDDFVERPSFKFQRYDMPLTVRWLADINQRGRRRGPHLCTTLQHLGEGPLTPRLMAKMQDLIAPDMIDRLGQLAAASALDQVNDADFPKIFDRVVIPGRP